MGSWNNVSWGNRTIHCCSVVTGVSTVRAFLAAASLAELDETCYYLNHIQELNHVAISAGTVSLDYLQISSCIVWPFLQQEPHGRLWTLHPGCQSTCLSIPAYKSDETEKELPWGISRTIENSCLEGSCNNQSNTWYWRFNPSPCFQLISNLSLISSVQLPQPLRTEWLKCTHWVC